MVRPQTPISGTMVVLGLSLAVTLMACGRLAQPDGPGAGGGSVSRSVPGSTGAADAASNPPGSTRACPETAVPPEAPPDTSISYSVCPREPLPVPKSEPVIPVPGMAGVHPVQWQRIDVGDDDRTLIVYFTSGVQPCNVLDHVEVRYGVDAVTITLHEGYDPGSVDLACPEIAIFKSVPVVLDEPLDGRDLLDGAAQS